MADITRAEFDNLAERVARLADKVETDDRALQDQCLALEEQIKILVANLTSSEKAWEERIKALEAHPVDDKPLRKQLADLQLYIDEVRYNKVDKTEYVRIMKPKITKPANGEEVRIGFLIEGEASMGTRVMLYRSKPNDDTEEMMGIVLARYGNSFIFEPTDLYSRPWEPGEAVLSVASESMRDNDNTTVRSDNVVIKVAAGAQNG